MTTEKRRELERALPESYKKGEAGLGDLIGWFVAGREGHFIFTGGADP